MRLDKIIKIVDDKEVKFSFYIDKNIYKNNNIVYIDVLNLKDRQIYKRQTQEDKEKYVSDSARILLPDITSERLGNIYINIDEFTYDFTLKNIRKIVSISRENENLAFTLYVILHEIGHWYHFDEMGRKPYSYAKEDADIRLKMFNKQQDLQMEMSVKKSMNQLTKKDIMTIKNWVIDYNNIPIEKKANKYADKNFKEMWRKLQLI